MSGVWLALAVGLAGAIGAVIRFGAEELWGHLVRRRRSLERGSRPAWPVALLAVNVLGSGLLGWWSGAWSHTAEGTPEAAWLAVLGAGLCGGLTTFSTWAVVAAQALREVRLLRALTVLAAHLVLGLGAAALGLALA